MISVILIRFGKWKLLGDNGAYAEIGLMILSAIGLILFLYVVMTERKQKE
jgi:hypothetical protein